MRRFFIVSAVALVLTACQKNAPPAAPSATATPAPAPAAAAAAPPAPKTIPTKDGQFSPDIRAEDFAAYVQTLASDAFEGRKPGTVGERMTTAYLKDQFERIGLKPANAGSFFQTVPMIETTLLEPDRVAGTLSTPQGDETLAYRTDLMIGTMDGSPAVEVKSSDVVFAGYGVVAPEYQWNDYAGLDAKGKTVVVLVNDPGWGNHDETLFKGRALTYYGRWTYKYEECARQGAAACLIVHETEGAAYPFSVVVSSWGGPILSLTPKDDPAPRLKAAGWITTDAARRAFAKAGKDFDALKKSADVRGFKASALGATFSVAFKNQVRNATSENVLGYVPGSAHPDEAIVYTAHWDHLGNTGDGPGDHIYNGAIDNGTGVAALLELADAFAHQSPPPAHSIVFVAVTLEESGLLGSQYYAAHPAFPLAKTLADINMDALPILGPSKTVAVYGLGNSDLDDRIKEAAATQGRTIGGDAFPEKGTFFRSDQLNFAKLGVPVLYAKGGLDLVDGGVEAGRKASEDYIANRYHKPGDEYDPNWDLRGTIADVQLLRMVGQAVDGADAWPQWRADSEFHRPVAPAAAGKKK